MANMSEFAIYVYNEESKSPRSIEAYREEKEKSHITPHGDAVNPANEA